jgi:aspartyl-tRNA(Asn)/glutamyl-tRNA(Gln) amidotransferase subunit A
VVGFKPAYGTLPVSGVFPLAQSLDHVGVLTATVGDAAYAVAALTAGFRAAVRSEPPRLGVVVNEEYLGYTSDVATAWSNALTRLQAQGATLVDIRLPDWKESFQAAADLQGPEAAANHAGRSTELYQPDVRQRLREAAALPLDQYDVARAKAAAITKAMNDLLRQVDAVITPTVLTTAPPIDAVSTEAGSLAVRAQLLRNTRLANLTGHPAMTVPLPSSGLPVGLQVIAIDNGQAAAIAGWVEAANQAARGTATEDRTISDGRSPR